MEIMNKTIDDILMSFTNVTSIPEDFLSVQEKAAKQLRALTKQLYDLTKLTEDQSESDALPELIVDNFDDEQVWQEIELQNDPCISQMVGSIALLTSGRQISFDPPRNEPTSAASGELSIEDGAEEIEEEDEEEESDEDDDEMLLDEGEEEEDGEESEEEKMLKQLLDKVADDHGKAAESGESSDENDGLAMPDELRTDKSDSTRKDRYRKGRKPDNTPKRTTVVDDRFFKMADMEEFLEAEDAREDKQSQGNRKEGSSDEESEEDYIDVFHDIPSDEEGKSGRELCYADFFDPVDADQKKFRFGDGKSLKEIHEEMDEEKEAENEEEIEDDEEEMEDDEEESSDGEDIADVLGHAEKGTNRSTFELRQEKVKQQIGDLEEQNLQPKSWQLSGEVAAGSRPENSLLEEHLDFEHTGKQAPLITEETTKTLEEIIIQRIKDQAFDDVERKEKPKEGIAEYKKRLVLDQEKSKLSLGEVYEQEFLKQTQTEQEEEDQANPKHESISKSMNSLFVKLDALSNFHYTPKPVAPDIQVITNLPSITMEEVQPVTTSDATLLAPEEVKKKMKKDLKGKEEKTKTDRLRERREKKKHQGAKQKHMEKKQKLLEKKNPKLAGKMAKDKAMAKLEKQSKGSKSVTIMQGQQQTSKKSGLTSSSQFFSQLQNEVVTQVKSKKAAANKAKEKNQKSAKAFKL